MAIQPFGLPPLEAIKLLKAKGFDMQPTFDWREMWGNGHATAFTVAKSTGFDILNDIYNEVLKAQSGQINYKTFVNDLTKTLQAKGWWGRKEVFNPDTGEVVEAQLGSSRRLDIIYNTNLRTAEAAGRWTQMEALKKERPFLRYICMNLPTSREEHRAWHGTILHKDDPWWDTHYPPNGWNCRCTVFELSEKDLKRYGWKVSDSSKIPYNDTVEWEDKSNGKIKHVSRGIDPAFDYNTGKVAIGEHNNKILQNTLEKLNIQLAAQLASADFVAQAARPALEEMYEQVTKRPNDLGKRQAVVGCLNQNVIDYYKEKTGELPSNGAIILTDYRMAHLLRADKKDRDAAISKWEVANLGTMLAHPEAIFWDQRHHNFVYVFPSTMDWKRKPNRDNSKVIVTVDVEENLRERKGGKKTITVVTTAGAVTEDNINEDEELSLVWP